MARSTSARRPPTNRSRIPTRRPSNPPACPTHVNQFVNPATGTGWTAGDANLADSSCGSVVLDRAPPTLNLQASDTTPATGDLVTFSASASDGISGVSGPYTWNFGDNTPSKQGANITHTYGDPGTYHVTLSGHDGAGNEGSAGVDLVVKTEKGGTGDEGTVITKPPSKEAIGGKDGTQTTTLGELKVIAPKKHRLGKKPTPILLTLIASQPGAFQAALTKGPKIVSKGAGVLASAGTFGFKLQLPKTSRPGDLQAAAHLRSRRRHVRLDENDPDQIPPPAEPAASTRLTGGRAPLDRRIRGPRPCGCRSAAGCGLRRLSRRQRRRKVTDSCQLAASEPPNEAELEPAKVSVVPPPRLEVGIVENPAGSSALLPSLSVLTNRPGLASPRFSVGGNGPL